MIKYPEKINDINLGITSISDGANKKLINVFDTLRENRISFNCSPFVFNSVNQVSNTSEKRAKDFLRMWNNNNINLIMSSFGGEFSMEILSYISEHKDDFIDNKKWFQGFSDASFLSFFLTTNYNIATINSYNAEDYGTKRKIINLKYDLDRIKELEKGYSFSQESSSIHIDDYTRDNNDFLNEIETNSICSKEKVDFSGRLIGGWIEALSTICGTKYDNTKEFCEQFPEGVIWYIDNCELTSPMLRRKLWQLKEAGYFDNCNGVLVGREPTDYFEGDYDYHKAICDTFDNIPVIEDVDVGHFFPQWAMINGSFAEVSYDKGKVKILERLK